MKKITVNTDNLDSSAPLYCQYDGQFNPQPAYIEIDPRGNDIEISADYSGEIGSSMPMRVWHNQVCQISCPYNVLGMSLIGYLESDEFAVLVTDLCKDYDERWNGNNHVGQWNDDYGGIIDKIMMDLEMVELCEIYEGDEWIEDSITYYDEGGKITGYEEDAYKATYESAEGDIEINKENLDKIVADAKSFIDFYQEVTGITSTVNRIIDAIEWNHN